MDDAGAIGHFATAGFKKLPLSVAQSAEDLASITEYFRSLNVVADYQVDDDLATEIPAPENRAQRYLSSFIEMAGRGLYSFDISSYLRPDASYFRVAIPKRPLHFDELPKSICKIVSLTRLKGKLLKSSIRIPYQETLGM